MKLDSELFRVVHRTREEARALRQAAEETRRRAEQLVARAQSLCAKYDILERREQEVRFRKGPQIGRGIHLLRIEVLQQLKQSLSDLESIRMIPDHDPELQGLKETIRKTLRQAESTNP